MGLLCSPFGRVPSRPLLVLSPVGMIPSFFCPTPPQSAAPLSNCLGSSQGRWGVGCRVSPSLPSLNLHAATLGVGDERSLLSPQLGELQKREWSR